MRSFRILATLLLSGLLIAAARPGQHPPELKSLHGYVLMPLWEKGELPPKSGTKVAYVSEIWARGEDTRMEMKGANGKAVIIIGHYGTMYTFGKGAQTGTIRHITSGLAAHGLIVQIEMIKARGKRVATYKHNGETYIHFEYSEWPHEAVNCVLSAKSWLPISWASVVGSSDPKKPASFLLLHYRDMQANVDIPDELFSVPFGVTFSEER